VRSKGPKEIKEYEPLNRSRFPERPCPQSILIEMGGIEAINKYEKRLREALENLRALFHGVNEVRVRVNVINEALLIPRLAEEVAGLTKEGKIKKGNAKTSKKKGKGRESSEQRIN
jgi:hypothetical protein